MRPELRFDESVLPPILIFILLICLGIAVIRSYRKEGFSRFERRTVWILSALRMLAIAAILFILLKPVWFRLKETVESGTVLLLVDVSESMEISDAPGRRLDKARIAASDLAESLADKYRVRSYRFAAFPEKVESDQLPLLDVRVTGVTNIGGCMQEALQAEGGNEVAGVILLTDGQHNSGPSPQEMVSTLRQRNIPVFAVGIGAERRFKDLELREFSVPRAMFRGEEARCSVRLVNFGFDEPEVPFRLRIAEHRPLIEGGPVDSRKGKPVVEQMLALPSPGTEKRYLFTFTPESDGIYRLRAEVDGLPEEEVTENNVREVEIEVTRERLRVLLIESTPRWEYGSILRSLRGDRRFAAAGLIEFQHGVYRFQGAELNPEHPWANRNYRAPLHPDWSHVDAVILGDVSPGDFQLQALEELRDRILEKGLILILSPGLRVTRAGGFDITPLRPLLPFLGLGEPVSGPIRVLPSLTGSNHPVMRIGSQDEPVADSWNRIHSLWGVYPAREVSPASVVLAEAKLEGEVHPVIAFRRTGQGKVLQLTVDDTWRWRVDPRPGRVAGNTPSVFWRQLVRWLITGRIDEPGAGVRLLVEKSTFTRGERVEIEARVDPPPGPQEAPLRLSAEITGADGLSEPIAMAPASPSAEAFQGSKLFRYSYVPLHYGTYQVRAMAYAGEKAAGRDEVTFFVAESGLERARASLNRQLLQDIAAATRGRYVDAQDYLAVADLVPERNTVRVAAATTRIWDSPLFFVLFTAALGLEWFIRKRKDMA